MSAAGNALTALASVVGLALLFAGHSAAAVATRGRVAASFAVGLLAGLAGVAAATALGLRTAGEDASEAPACWLLNLVGYLAFFYCYFHFVNLNMTSLRIRVLLEFLDAPDGLSQDDILRLYDARELTARRLVRLVRQGQLVDRDGRFVVRGRSLVAIAAVMDLLKRIVVGRGNRTLESARERDGRNEADS